LHVRAPGGLEQESFGHAARRLPAVPRSWSIALAICVVCLLASMVIAIARLT
jgi:hypothetical protein